MKKSKYAISEYWRAKINNKENFWEGLFANQPIEKNSIIINPVILNSYSNQIEDAWAVYPNLESVIGFIQYIYLPTAFVGLIKEQNMEAQYYFQENLDGLLNQYKEDYPEKVQLLNKMEGLYFELMNCWIENKEDRLNKLKQWSNSFNENWEGKSGVTLSFNLFSSPREVATYIIKGYEEDLTIESLEEDIGMAKSQFLELTSDEIFQNDFMKRKFTDILTNRLNVTF